MKFRAAHCEFFNASVGAYSFVTDREIHDSQITLTDFEAELFTNYFTDIHTGNVTSDPTASSKKFIFFNTKNVIELNVVFPKPNKTELRLYLSKRAGFMPDPGDVIFFYVSNKAIYIGNLPEKIWRDLVSYKYRIDQDDDIFQNAIEFDEIPNKVSKTTSSYPRNPKLAQKAITNANHECENKREHWLFKSRRTNQNFVEAHHLFPVAATELLGKNMDFVENIFALCPGCHRAIHYGDNQSSFEIINHLYELRKPLFEQAALNHTDLLTIYSVEKIDGHAN
jgi:5-methylcytosine-specific restriction enzyme A